MLIKALTYVRHTNNVCASLDSIVHIRWRSVICRPISFQRVTVCMTIIGFVVSRTVDLLCASVLCCVVFFSLFLLFIFEKRVELNCCPLRMHAEREVHWCRNDTQHSKSTIHYKTCLKSHTNQT